LRLFRKHAPVAQEAPARWDRLVNLPDHELDVPRLIEGCCAHFFGTPLDANPWPRAEGALWQAWRHGWLQASLYRDLWEQDDTQTWLLNIDPITED